MIKNITPVVLTTALMFAGCATNSQEAQPKPQEKQEPVKQSSLFEAINNNDLNALKTLLSKKNVELNVLNDDGYTPLHKAIINKNYLVVKLLLEKGADITVKTKWKESPLFLALKYDNFTALQALLEKGADINAPLRRGRLALNVAITYADRKVIDFLLTKGANVNAQDRDGFAPIHLAANSNRLDLYKHLRKMGAQNTLQDTRGNDVLYFAVKGADVNFLDYLVKQENLQPIAEHLHASVVARNIKALEYLLAYGLDVEATTRLGVTPVETAIKSGRLKMLSYLVQKGAKLNSVRRGATLFQRALEANQGEILEYLFNNTDKKDFQGYEGFKSFLIALKERNLYFAQKIIDLNDGYFPNLTKEDQARVLYYIIQTQAFDLLDKYLAHYPEVDLKLRRDTSPFTRALLRKNFKMAEYLLSKGANINIRDYRGRTPLDAALKSRGKGESIEFLLKHNAKSDKSEAALKTELLNYALKYNNFSLLKNIYTADMPINTRLGYNRRPAIGYAAANDNLEMAKFLLSKGADVDLGDSRNKSALFFAINNQNFKMVKLLLENGASLDRGGEYGAFVHYVQSSKKNIENELEYLKLFLKYGLDVKKARGYADKPVLSIVLKQKRLALAKELIKLGVGVHERDRYNKNPILTLGLKARDISFLKILLEKGIDFKQRDRYGNTLLHEAVKLHDEKLVRFMLEQGLDINAQNDSWRTPLLDSLNVSDEAMTRFLIAQGANIDAQDKRGLTALHYSLRNANHDLVMYFLKHGADIKHLTKSKTSALHQAVLGGNLNLIKMVLAKGFDINSKDKYEQTPLHLAVQRKKLDVVKFLIKQGADINSKDNRGDTPLHTATKATKNKEMIVFLLQNGANTKIVNLLGKTPLAAASRYTDKAEMMKVFLEYARAEKQYEDMHVNIMKEAGFGSMFRLKTKDMEIFTYKREKDSFQLRFVNNTRQPMVLANIVFSINGKKVFEDFKNMTLTKYAYTDVVINLANSKVYKELVFSKTNFKAKFELKTTYKLNNEIKTYHHDRDLTIYLD